MFNHDSFVFIHLPKTGGWTVRRILNAAKLRNAIPRRHNQHSALHELPEDITADKILLCTLREPCAWYRSYIHYCVKKDGDHSTFLQRFIGDKPFELKSVLEQVIFPEESIHRMQILGLKEDADAKLMRALGIGMYTWTVLNMLNRSIPDLDTHTVAIDRIIDTGQLREGLREVMAELQLNIELGLALQPDDNRNEDLVARGKRILPYSKPLEEDFDAEMIQWIYQQDRFIVELMGYTGPGTTATSPVIRPRSP